jgi:hypothetical protein
VTANSKRIIVSIALALAVLYAGDYLVMKIRAHKGQKIFGTVEVENYSAVPEKNNKVEFFYDEPDTEECVHALFPHFGDNPCWYDNLHRVNRTDL